jgi:RNA polymerase sigma factor (TIGR02999 family)
VIDPAPEDLTQLLTDSASGSVDARDRLLRIVYDDLHAMARARMRGERRDHTLNPTALVAEAYMRLFRATDPDGTDSFEFANRRGFFTAAATTMRRILIDYARARASEKRGGRTPRGERRVPLDVLEAAANLDPQEILALDDACSRLEEVDERAATVVHLRFFGGLEIAEVAEMLGVSERTVKRDWEFARALLREAMASQDDTDDDTTAPGE